MGILHHPRFTGNWILPPKRCWVLWSRFFLIRGGNLTKYINVIIRNKSQGKFVKCIAILKIKQFQQNMIEKEVEFPTLSKYECSLINECTSLSLTVDSGLWKSVAWWLRSGNVSQPEARSSNGDVRFRISLSQFQKARKPFCDCTLCLHWRRHGFFWGKMFGKLGMKNHILTF